MSLSPAKIPEDVVFELERALAWPLFMGASLGPTLNDLFIISFLNGLGGWSRGAAVTDLGRTLASLVPHRPADAPPPPEMGGRVWLTTISGRANLRGLVEPLVRQGDPRRIALIGSPSALTMELPPGVPFYDWDQVGPRPSIAWAQEFMPRWPIWQARLALVLARYRISALVVPRLYHWLVTQSQRVRAYIQLLSAARPAAVLTEFDRNKHAACLVAACHALGIPTYTMVHGMINYRYGFLPLHADQVLCWGQEHADHFIAHGVHRSRIDVVGAQHLTRQLACRESDARLALGLDAQQPVALLATTPIAHASQQRLAEVFCQACAEVGEMQALVRLHPSEQLAMYDDQIRRYPAVRFVLNQAISEDQALAASSVVVCHNTTFAINALLKRRPVVIADVIPQPLLGVQKLIDRAGCPRADSATGLAAVLERIAVEDSYQLELVDAADRYISRLCASFGEESARSIIRAVPALDVAS